MTDQEGLAQTDERQDEADYNRCWADYHVVLPGIVSVTGLANEFAASYRDWQSLKRIQGIDVLL